ncbi:Thiamine-monophosphate kinase [Klebsiella pneumoniae ISC21]|nr:Thiamine-monophosphate kinase [Klebsiella pneumoniae ISC21]
MPYSDAILRQVEPEQALRWALAGGEDYELCFTVPELNRGALDVALGHLGARFLPVSDRLRRRAKGCSLSATVSRSRLI